MPCYTEPDCTPMSALGARQGVVTAVVTVQIATDTRTIRPAGEPQWTDAPIPFISIRHFRWFVLARQLRQCS